MTMPISVLEELRPKAIVDKELITRESEFSSRAIAESGSLNEDTPIDRPLDHEAALEFRHDSMQADLQGEEQESHASKAGILVRLTSQKRSAGERRDTQALEDGRLAIEVREAELAASAAERAYERSAQYGLAVGVVFLGWLETPIIESMVGAILDIGRTPARTATALILVTQTLAFHAAGFFLRKVETSSEPYRIRRNQTGLVVLFNLIGSVIGIGTVVVRNSEYLENLLPEQTASSAPLWLFAGLQGGVSLLSLAAGYIAFSREASNMRAIAKEKELSRVKLGELEAELTEILEQEELVTSFDVREAFAACARGFAAQFAWCSSDFRGMLSNELARRDDQVAMWRLGLIQRPSFEVPIADFDLEGDDLGGGGTLALI